MKAANLGASPGTKQFQHKSTEAKNGILTNSPSNVTATLDVLKNGLKHVNYLEGNLRCSIRLMIRAWDRITTACGAIDCSYWFRVAFHNLIDSETTGGFIGAMFPLLRNMYETLRILILRSSPRGLRHEVLASVFSLTSPIWIRHNRVKYVYIYSLFFHSSD